jgi:ParB family chromosome partitioning protein
MIDAGLSTTRVAKALSVHRDTVKAAAAAAKSPAAMDALTSGQMTLLEAAAVVEFIVIWTHVRVACRTTMVK